MLRPIATSSASAGSAPTAVHPSSAATLAPRESGVTSVGGAESAQAQSGAGASQQIFRYNSFEFIYRQDIGRIVLIGQSPETGERVIQVPSEQALRAYERTERVERQIARGQADRAASQPANSPASRLDRALAAAVGDNDGNGVISVSA